MTTPVIFLYQASISEMSDSAAAYRWLTLFGQYLEDVHGYRYPSFSTIIGRVLLIRGLADQGLNVKNIIAGLRYNENGKPFLPDQKWRFNITHGGDLVILSIGNEIETGIDIERVKTFGENHIPFFLNREELDRLPEQADTNTFLTHIWVKKEATAKMMGGGWGMQYQSFPAGSRPSMNGQPFTLVELKIEPGHICYLAADHPEVELQIRQMHPSEFETYLSDYIQTTRK